MTDMAPEKWASAIMEKHFGLFYPDVRQDITKAIREAVAAEREACAVEAETETYDHLSSTPIATAIRRRDNG